MTSGEQFERLVEIMHRLRRECPWDREQTHATLRPYLLEETYEVLDVLDQERHDDLCEELGDLLLQVVFHAEVAAEQGRFGIGDVCDAINRKLVRRHPHVFDQADCAGHEEAARRWDGIKTGVERKESLLSGVPRQLPALLKAARVLAKLRNAGVEALPAGEAGELARRCLDRPDGEGEAERRIGLLCLAAAALALALQVDPEDALRETTGRVMAAFQREERALREGGRDLLALSDDERSQVLQALRILWAEEGQ